MGVLLLVPDPAPADASIRLTAEPGYSIQAATFCRTTLVACSSAAADTRGAGHHHHCIRLMKSPRSFSASWSFAGNARRLVPPVRVSSWP